jgi:large subunit ribosomal protein L17
MRHLRTVSKLSRTKSHRRALLMNMANSLFQHESIKTTDTKAMELKRVADRLITLAKKKDLHSMRLVFAFLRDKGVVKKLFADIGDRYLSINGGYTRVLKIGRRKGDAAPMAIIELTQKKESEDKGTKETKEKTKKVKKEKEEK